MRWLPIAFLLVACGGGAAYDPVTRVTLTWEAMLGPMGEATWGEAGSAVRLSADFDSEWRLLTLKHELWHLLTRVEGHVNGEGCVSREDPGDGFWIEDTPCPDEVAQVNDAGRVVTISFPEDPECAREAAAWWNAAAGRACVIVVE